MQTHKNPGLRSGPAPFKAPGGAGASPGNVKSVAATQDKPPVFERDGKKWIIVSGDDGGWCRKLNIKVLKRHLICNMSG